MKKVLVLGGGIAGCAAAHQFALKGGWDITLVESAPFLGAGVRTHWYGGHPYTFGPRHFLTPWEEVFDFLNAYVPMRRCKEHQFLTYAEGDQAFYNFPIHVDDIPRMPDRGAVEYELARRRPLEEAQDFEQYWLNAVGPTLYRKFVDGYSRKMWRIEDNRTLDTFEWSPKGVPLKEGPREAWDTAISAYPTAPDGYNAYFKIATAGAKVHLNTHIEEFGILAKSVKLGGDWQKFDIVVSTLSPDDLFDNELGLLPYVGRDLVKVVLPVEHALPENVYFAYYPGEEKFTRITEYKKFTQHKAPTTLLSLEIPSTNGRYYPMPTKAAQALAQQYLDLLPEGVFSIGRNGSYRYGIDIDNCIKQAMEVAAAC